MYSAASCGKPDGGGRIAGDWAAGGSCPEVPGSGVGAASGSPATGAIGEAAGDGGGRRTRFGGVGAGGRTASGGASAAQPPTTKHAKTMIAASNRLRIVNVLVHQSAVCLYPPIGFLAHRLLTQRHRLW